MMTEKTARRRPYAEFQWAATVHTTAIEDDESQAKRSARNILVWKTYLPADCIKDHDCNALGTSTDVIGGF